MWKFIDFIHKDGYVVLKSGSSKQDKPMSLDMMEVVLEVEEEFGIKIPDSDIPMTDAISIGDLYDITLKRVREQSKSNSQAGNLEDEVWERLKALLIDQLDLKPEQIVKSNRFYHELGFR
jgi:hypothetical protein